MASFAKIEDMLASMRSLGAPGNRKLNLAQGASFLQKARMDKLALLQSGTEGYIGEAIELPEVKASRPHRPQLA